MSWANLIKNATELPHKFLVDGMEFGEIPRFHNGKLYVSDMLGKKIYTIDKSGRKEVLIEVEQQPNGMCFMYDGSLIYSSMFDAKLYRYSNGKSELYAELSAMTGYCGDMVINKQGRIYVDDTGARVLHGETGARGRILIVEPDRTVKVGPDDIGFPNGNAIDCAGEVLYNSDSRGSVVNAFDLSNTGELLNRREFWKFNDLTDASPLNDIDGLCMDSEDGMWLSMLDYSMFVRRDMQGQITHLIKVDGHATACALGGEDGKTLYLVTNKIPDSEDDGSVALFRAMMNHESKCTISTARVEVPRGKALP